MSVISDDPSVPRKLAREWRPRGKALRLPGAQLDVLSTVSAADVKRARAAWARVITRVYRALLEASGDA